MRYRAVPANEIGDLDGPVSLTFVPALVVTAGRLHVLQVLDKQIRVLSTDGEPLEVWGRHGDGPGEYQSPRWLGFVDDRLVVVDWTQRRMTHLTLDGRVVATRPTPRVQSPDHWFNAPIFAGAGGRVVMFGSTIRRLPEQWEQVPVLVFDSAGAVQDSLWFRFGKRRIFLGDARGEYSTAHPIVDGATWGMSPDGSVLAIADHLAPDAELLVTLYHLETGIQDTISLPFPMAHVPQAYADSVEAQIFDGQSALVERFGRQAIREAIRSPAQVSAADALFVTDRGDVWIRQPNFQSKPDTWYIVTPRGTVRAQVEVPRGLDIMAVEDTAVWAHRQDRFFVSYVVRLRLEPHDD